MQWLLEKRQTCVSLVFHGRLRFYWDRKMDDVWFSDFQDPLQVIIIYKWYRVIWRLREGLVEFVNQVAIRQCTGQLKYCYEYQAVQPSADVVLPWFFAFLPGFLSFLTDLFQACSDTCQSSLHFAQNARAWMGDLSSRPWQIVASHGPK